MGLAEKRQQKDFETNVLPKMIADIQKAVGKKVEVEIEWEPFHDGYGHCIEGMGHYAGEAIVEALNKICKDDLGREAVQEALKKIRLVHNPSAVSIFDFSSGTLLIKHFWGSGGVKSDYIEDCIMKKL
jgi:hypothetical protein